MIVGDLAVPDHQVVREHPAYRLVEAAADGLVRHLELLEDLGISRAHELESLLHEVDRLRCGVGYEVGPRPAPFQGVGPLLRYRPLEARLGPGGGPRQIDLDAAARRLDVAGVHEPGQSRGPQPGQRPAAGVEREVVPGALVQPAWAHHPAVVLVEVPLLGLGQRGLVPGVPLVYRVAERIAGNEWLL